MKRSRYITILIHVIAWAAFIVLPIIIFDIHYDKADNFGLFYRTFHIILIILLFYTNYYLFIPKLLSRRKFLFYGLALTASVVVIFYLTYGASYIYHNKYHDEYSDTRSRYKEYWKNRSDQENKEQGEKNSNEPDRDKKVKRWHRKSSDPAIRRMQKTGRDMGIIYTSLFVLALSTSIRVTQEWYRNEKQKREMQSEKLVSELSFLRSQVNPHFLFNTLNNIYALSNRKSDKAPAAIQKLSELMRYMLYESKDEKVRLSKEIEYLKNYIDLQKLRLTEDVRIVFETEGDIQDKMIEPLLLIPFVENAFKHGISYTQDMVISIRLKVTEDELELIVENPVDESLMNKDVPSGIGLENIRKRLNLLYPDKSNLKIIHSHNRHRIELTINLK